MPISQKPSKPSKQRAWLFKVNTLRPVLSTLTTRKVFQRLLRALAILAVLGLGVVKNPTHAQPQCQLQLNETTIDLGSFSRDQPTQIPGMSLLSLGKRTINLTASCGTNSVIALSFRALQGSEVGYRFAKNGIFTLKIIDAQLDGKPVRLRTLDTTTSTPNQPFLRPGDKLAPYSGPVLASGEHLSLQIEIETMIDREGTRVSADEELEGMGRFEVRAIQPD